MRARAVGGRGGSWENGAVGRGQRRRADSVARFKWVIGTPYFVQGTSSLVEVPVLYFIKFALGMGDAGGQLFDSLRNGGWFVKPLWGYISDRVPLFGYRRKSWFVLMALLATVFWTLNAALVALGLRVPVVFLLTFNLALATYAFVDVVCDALMVTRGRELRRVGSFVNFQWTMLALANAGAIFLGGRLQQSYERGEIPLWLIFLLTGVPPLFTAVVGVRNIDEEPATRIPAREASTRTASERWRGAWRSLRGNRTILILMLFIFFWRFSPSVGYIERSYLIDARGFGPSSFGVILSAGSVTFLASLLAYRWVVGRFRGIRWHHYLYAMAAVGVLSFPLSFFLYLDPEHPWWRVIELFLPQGWSLPAGWNRYEGFRLVTEVVLGFATIPAFIIPLTIAGETVKIERAGASYALLMSLANVTNMFEGAVGAALYRLFTRAEMRQLLDAFHGSPFDVARVGDERTLILQIFVYISLFFTLLTVPFIRLLKKELDRRGVVIDLAGASEAQAAAEQK